ncbi:MAG: ATP-binding protein, partial [Candidatus Marinimicrobia bacterium]|nr:ATP-binding protein [Candidatus Neomarinimicrobiota bacterium]
VMDNGKGISKKDRRNIFRPGYSTKKRGWGLGLSLTQRIVKDYHYGKIFVKESKPGEATVIRIVLRRAKED